MRCGKIATLESQVGVFLQICSRKVISSAGTITRAGLSDDEWMFGGSEAGSQLRVLVTYLGCDQCTQQCLRKESCYLVHKQLCYGHSWK